MSTSRYNGKNQYYFQSSGLVNMSQAYNKSILFSGLMKPKRQSVYLFIFNASFVDLVFVKLTSFTCIVIVMHV